MHKLIAILVTLIAIPVLAQQDNSSLRYKAADAIEKYVKEKLGERAEQYEALKFGSLVTHKPQAYVELEDMQRLREELPYMEDYYGSRLDSVIAANDSMIQAKKREIMDNKIRVSYEINHVFKLETSQREREIHNVNFFLSHAMEVKNLEYNYKANLSLKESRVYFHYIMRYPLMETGDAREDQRYSNDIYDFYEDRFIDLDYDTDFLKHMLKVFHHVYQNGYMDVDKLGQELISNHIEAEGLLAYRPEEFSPMYQLELTDTTTGRDTLIGYKMFHSLTFKEEDSQDRIEEGFYFEFDLYFMIRGVFRLEKPYDQYFMEE